MRRTPLTLAVVAGIAAASGYAVTTSGQAVTPLPPLPAVGSTPTGPIAAQDPSPRIGGMIQLGRGYEGRSLDALPGTIRVATTAPDPAGGAPWAVRSWMRDGIHGGTTWCAQLGRIVDGRFVWVMPGSTQAGPIRARVDDVTVCDATAPISQRLGVMVASMPDRTPTDPSAQIEATLIWGSVDRPVERASVSQNGATLPVRVTRHAFLRVLPGTVPSTRARLTVVDFPKNVSPKHGNRRTRQAIPPAFFDLNRRIPGRPYPYAEPSTLHEFETVGSGSSDLPSAMFVRYAGGGLPTCYVGPQQVVAGRAVVGDRYSGLVRQPILACTTLPTKVDRPMAFGGSGWSSGDPVAPGSVEAGAAYERRVWRRVLPGGGGVLLAVPKGTAMLEVQSPVGVKTVRVGPERVTYLSWEGQPEVMHALFPSHEVDGIPLGRLARMKPAERERAMAQVRVQSRSFWLAPPLRYRALDAQGHQVGRLGSAAG